MKLVALAIMVFIVMTRQTTDSRRIRSPVVSITTQDTAMDSTTPTPPSTTKTVFNGTIIPAAKVFNVTKCVAPSPDVRVADFRKYIAMVFILILILLAGFNVIFLQMILRKGEYSNGDFVVFSVTIFVIIMNCFTLVFLLKNVTMDES